MNEGDSSYDMSTPCEGGEELNGEGASYRNAPMISAPRVIQKMRIRGALVPMGREDEALN